jgi:DNA-binding NarL/FixJ family response regulator
VTAQIVGRETELEAIGRFAARDGTRALVLTGAPGMGKTTLWEAGGAIAGFDGARVLVARPSGAEARLAFAALIDLCEDVDEAALAQLPPPQRAALEVALLRAEPGTVPPEPRAIALALLNLLRALAAERPLLIAIDDLQWLDPSSEDALVFAARRLDSEAIGLLLARRPRRRTPLERVLDRRLERIEVGPLDVDETRRMLADRLGLSLPRSQLQRIVDAAEGNPLYALELGRTLLEHGLSDGELPLPHSLDRLLGRRVGALDPEARGLLLAVALAPDLREGELSALSGHDAVEDAVEAGLLRIDAGRVRTAHPLLAAAARKRSRASERRAIHGRLADTLEDQPRRVLHLALATDRPDPALAAQLDAAAGEASARGARRQAVRLADHALRLTPGDAPERPERLLALAGHLCTAGEVRRLTELLEPAIPSLPPGAPRARGWLLLSEAEGAGPQTVDEVERLLDRALEEAQTDPELRSGILARRADNAASSRITRIHEAEGFAREAMSCAVGCGRDVQRYALYALGWTRAMAGHAIDDLCERSSAIADPAAYITLSPERVAAQRLVWRGEIEAARAALFPLLAAADDRGEPTSYALMRLHVTELELRVGDWAAAARRLDEWAESAERDLLIRPMYQRCRALLAAGLGDENETKRWARNAVSRAEVTGSRWDWLEAQRARGIGALAGREPGRAAEVLRPVWEHVEREDLDPGVFPAAPELVEALVDLGELEAASRVAERLHAMGERHEHPWALASAQRCRAVVALAGEGHDAEAAQALADAAATYARLGLAFDHARSLLALGRAQRRVKQWGAARQSLEDAAAAFDALGSAGWAEHARVDLGRVGGRPPRASGELTATEREIVDLAVDGLANKEIARALHLAVHTVEVHLSRIYRKLGVSSRNQLAARLSGRGA